MNFELKNAILEESAANGYDPVDVATLMSYETAGTFDDWKRGPITQHGQHRGLIQWGAPQRRRYGVYKGMPVKDQVKASMAYLRDAGAKPGMGLLDLYSAVNAGKVGRYNRTDENNGGAPGTVRDKVENQMSGHRQKALALLGGDFQAQPAIQAVNAMAEGQMPSTGPRAPDGTPVTLAGMGELPEGFELDISPIEAPTDKPLYQVQAPSEKTPFAPDLPEGFIIDDDAQDAPVNELSALTQNPQSDLAGPALVPGMNAQTVSEQPGSPAQSQAFLEGMVSGVPIVGPALEGLSNRATAGVASALSSDLDYGEALARTEQMKADRAAQNPTGALAGNITGAVGGYLAGGATTLGAKALGVTGRNLLTRSIAGIGSNAAISGADTLARGGDSSDAGKSALIGGALGALPGAATVVGRAVGSLAGWLGRTTRGALNPNAQAQKVIGGAMRQDNALGQGISQADEASAALNGQEILNVDRGGEATRRLAIGAANTDAGAEQMLTNATKPRFQEQGARTISFIDRMMGGNTDDLAAQAALKESAAVENRVAYEAAHNAPSAQSIWTPKLKTLAQAPALRQAMSSAETNGANRAVAEGFKPIKNPFREVKGVLQPIEGVTPNLRYWDQVKRNLDDKIGSAFRSGENSLGANLSELKKQLVKELDIVVPKYATARAGASAWFGAQDALEAGKAAVTLKKQLPEMKAAFSKFTKSEKELAAVGFASSLKDAIKEAGENRNILINQVFGSPAAMERINLFLGPARAKEMEAFLRVETAMDTIRATLPRSTTAKQLRDMGIMGGGAGISAGYATGDFKTGAIVGTLVAGAKAAGVHADQQVMRRIAEVLVSSDKDAMKEAVRIATKTKSGMVALKALQEQAIKLIPAAGIAAGQQD